MPAKRPIITLLALSLLCVLLVGGLLIGLTGGAANAPADDDDELATGLKAGARRPHRSFELHKVVRAGAAAPTQGPVAARRAMPRPADLPRLTAALERAPSEYALQSAARSFLQAAYQLPARERDAQLARLDRIITRRGLATDEVRSQAL